MTLLRDKLAMLLKGTIMLLVPLGAGDVPIVNEVI